MGSLTKGEAARARILDAAVDIICERGLIATRISDIGERVGMSPGHVMYYFSTREEILIEALRLVNDRFFASTWEAVEVLPSARERLLRLIEFGAPNAPEDNSTPSQWLLWLDVWAESPRSEVVDADRRRLELRWIEAYETTVRQGQEAGEFRSVDPRDFAIRLSAMIDGLGKSVTLDDEWMTRQTMLEICTRMVDDELVAGR